MEDPKYRLGHVLDPCRVCLYNSSVMYEIFGFSEVKQSNISEQRICDRIYYCTGVQVEAIDGLPTKICQSCHSLLQYAYEFKTQFLETNEILQQKLLDRKIKENHEIPEKLDFDSLLEKDAKFDKKDHYSSKIVKKEDFLCKDDITDIHDYCDDNTHQTFNDDTDMENKHDDDIKIEVPLKTEFLSKIEVIPKEINIPDSIKIEKVDIVDLDDYKPIATVFKTENRMKPKKADCNNIIEKLASFNGLQIKKLSNSMKSSKTTKKKIMKNKIKKKSTKYVKTTEKSTSKSLANPIPIKKADPPFNVNKEIIRNNSSFKLVVNKKSPKAKSDKVIKRRIRKANKDKSEVKPKPKAENCICEHCGITLLRSSHAEHVRTHFPPTLACDFPNCTYKAWRLTGLTRHKLKHTDVRNHLCQKCPKSFKSLSQLRDHEKFVHVDKERKFKCDYCDKSYYTRSNLKIHINIKHGDETFKCDDCDLGFSERQLWRKHMIKTHNIEIPFARSGRKRNMILE